MPPPVFQMAEGVNSDEVQNLIRRYLAEAKRHPGTILSESDLKCGLSKKLSEHPILRAPLATRSGAQYTASWVHSEIPWFDSEGKLTYIPDITILNPQALELVKKPGYKLPNKQCAFDGKAILLELKFAKKPSGLDKTAVKEIRKDLTKISALLERLRGEDAEQEVFCLFVVVHRFGKICAEWAALKENIENTERCALISFTLGFPIAPPNRF